MTATAPEPPRPTATRRLAGPPGVLFYLATLGAILVAFDANTRQSLALLLLSVPIWFGLAGAWGIRFLIALHETRGRMSVAHWARWVAIPLALGLVFAVTRTTVLIQGRFEAGGSLERGWVGLYDVGSAERTDNGFWFTVDDSGLGRWGLVYSPDGEPQESDENYSPLWSGASFDHIDGPWWTFQQAWD
jgi:hypothetical protein